jgi:iron complex transport system ATP-binding protein
MGIAASHLSVVRLGKTVLQDVSLKIDSGECVSIIGPNGAGKSTLMASLLGLLPLAAGNVELDDAPIRSLSHRHIAQRVAYVPQMHEGYLGFRVRDVIESARYAHLNRLDPLGAEDRATINAAVEATQVGELLDRTVDTLSGGERQKVWITAALAQNSPALFLDEPTSALDPAHQADLIRIMRAARRDGRTLLVICHDLNLPLALGGRVVALQDGTVAFDEPIDVLADTDRLAQLFGTRFALHRGPDDRFSVQLELEPPA